MSQNFYKKLVSELMYGEDCVVLDNDTISEFVHWKKYVIESSSKSQKIFYITINRLSNC